MQRISHLRVLNDERLYTAVFHRESRFGLRLPLATSAYLWVVARRLVGVEADAIDDRAAGNRSAHPRTFPHYSGR